MQASLGTHGPWAPAFAASDLWRLPTSVHAIGFAAIILWMVLIVALVEGLIGFSALI